MGRGLCKSCYGKQRYHTDGGKTKAKMQTYAHAHPAMRDAVWRKHAYGLSREEWLALYERQGGRCAICEKPDTPNALNIDHDHHTGRVRGMLCGHCNKGLGLFRDQPALLQYAYQYLRGMCAMSKKRDAIVYVIRFFQTAPLDAANAALAMVREILRLRVEAERPAAAARAKSTTKKATAAADPVPPLN